MKGMHIIILLGFISFGSLSLVNTQSRNANENIYSSGSSSSSSSEEGSSEESNELLSEESSSENSSEENQTFQIQLKDLLKKQLKITDIKAFNLILESLKPPALPTRRPVLSRVVYLAQAEITKTTPSPLNVASEGQLQNYEKNQKQEVTVLPLSPPPTTYKPSILNTLLKANQLSNSDQLEISQTTPSALEVTSVLSTHTFPTQRPPENARSNVVGSQSAILSNGDQKSTLLSSPILNETILSNSSPWNYNPATSSPTSAPFALEDAFPTTALPLSPTLNNFSSIQERKRIEPSTKYLRENYDYEESETNEDDDSTNGTGFDVNEDAGSVNEGDGTVDTSFEADTLKYNPWVHNFYDRFEDGSYVYGYSLPNGVRRFERSYNSEKNGRVVEGFYTEVRHLDHGSKYELRCYRADANGYHPLKVEYVTRPPLVQRDIEPEVDCFHHNSK